jgi:hypothetical protein
LVFTARCTSVQFFGEKRSQRRVDRLKTRALALQSAAGAFCRPGCAARCAPTTALPRRPCRAVPMPRAASRRFPSASTALERELHLPRRTASYGELRIARRSVVRSPATRGSLGRRLTVQLRRTSFSSRTGGAAGYLGRCCCPCAGWRSLLHGAGRRGCRPCSSPASLGTPSLPPPAKSPSSPTQPPPSHGNARAPPRLERRRTEGRRGSAPGAPPAGRPPALSHLPAPTNRSMVGPSTFSTHSPAESITGAA